MLKYLFILFIFIEDIRCQKKNVCKTFKDYDNIEHNPNCYTNYAADKSAPEVIQLNGYPFEEHKVVNSDGYILTMHRIPNRNHQNPKKSPVYLNHGLPLCSLSFLLLGNNSLAFLLADQGYDVWLGNYRGNIYSYEHTTLTQNDDEYWKFSIDDLALVDIPQTLKYISNITSAMGEIIYIGHSLGTFVSVMFASDKPAEAKSLIKTMYLLATGDSLRNTKSKIFGLIRFYKYIHDIVESLGLGDVLLNGFITSPLLKKICLNSAFAMEKCYKILGVSAGTNNSGAPETFPPLINAVLVGTSLRIIKQLSDFFTHTFRKYNYGLFTNLMTYGQISPPAYMFENIQVPTYIYASTGDWMNDIEDTRHLYARLPTSSRRGFYTIPSNSFNHLDYLNGVNAKELVFDHLINRISNLN